MTRERRPGLRVEGPHVEAVGVVLDGGQAQDPADVGHGEAEGPALGRIDGELADELTFGRELDQLAGLSRVRVDRVAVGGDQVAVGRQDQAERSAEVRIIKHHGPFPSSLVRVAAFGMAKISLSPVEAT